MLFSKKFKECDVIILINLFNYVNIFEMAVFLCTQMLQGLQ